ncbi:MAG: hypothetical protein JWQ66_1002 [Mucilaginibacter sp.]|nr:hypothetical protein [Mucilaginibacter sp.]
MNFSKTGYVFGVSATALVLLWIGALKFTAAEAMAIKPYIENSFLISWLYMVASVQITSNLIGIFEIATGILLIASLLKPALDKIAGYAALIIFVTTITFLITTPNIWKLDGGVPVTDFFVVKDLAFLAIALQVIGNNRRHRVNAL